MRFVSGIVKQRRRRKEKKISAKIYKQHIILDFFRQFISVAEREIVSKLCATFLAYQLMVFLYLNNVFIVHVSFYPTRQD